MSCSDDDGAMAQRREAGAPRTILITMYRVPQAAKTAVAANRTVCLTHHYHHSALSTTSPPPPLPTAPSVNHSHCTLTDLVACIPAVLCTYVYVFSAV